MLLRDMHAQLKWMRRLATEGDVSPARAAAMIQPFIDKHKALRLTMGDPAAASHTPCMAHSRDSEIVAAALDAGRQMQRARLKGLAFHNGYQRALAAGGAAFGYRGFVESGAEYLGESGADAVCGRVDVAWAGGRAPQVVFEIDSTVKAASLWKLRQAQVPHKYWIYFGKDVWGFKMFLRKQDARGEVRGIVLPRAWKPT